MTLPSSFLYVSPTSNSCSLTIKCGRVCGLCQTCWCIDIKIYFSFKLEDGNVMTISYNGLLSNFLLILRMICDLLNIDKLFRKFSFTCSFQIMIQLMCHHKNYLSHHY